jgi:Leucine-rich repeat (LRR) protein
LRNLKYLNMVKNKLKDLPQEMTQIDTLEELNLSINKIAELPRGFGSYNHLRFLDLSFNCLTELSPQIGLLSTLIELHISFNKLKSLPAEIGTSPLATRYSLLATRISVRPHACTRTAARRAKCSTVVLTHAPVSSCV